ncbi:AAA family ATPase [Hominifimenecus sp. rT4P-3]|uniref:cytidylate kinase-like family protein n=1 Tax=Hominifimenecus sp. rT4P-3 TaxID=3242979 RepID=UPI003DA2ECF8
MQGNRVITIGREFGSSGREIGEKLAETLGINFYDKELIALASKESGLCPEVFEKQDEKPVNSFFYSLVMDTHGMGQPISGYMDVPLNQKVFLAQFDTIQKLAKKESCVIVGRCADYALASFPNVTSVFICGNMEDKVNRVAETFHMAKDKAMDLIAKTDKKRANYYNYYSNKKWGSAGSYDLCLNSTLTGVDGAVHIILEFLKAKDKENSAK